MILLKEYRVNKAPVWVRGASSPKGCGSVPRLDPVSPTLSGVSFPAPGPSPALLMSRGAASCKMHFSLHGQSASSQVQPTGATGLAFGSVCWRDQLVAVIRTMDRTETRDVQRGWFSHEQQH